MVELDAEDSSKLTGPANDVLLLQYLHAATHSTHIVVHHFPSTITNTHSSTADFHFNVANITYDLQIYMIGTLWRTKLFFEQHGNK